MLQALDGTLGSWFEEESAAVMVATGSLCEKLAGAYGTSAEASRAVQYELSYSPPASLAAAAAAAYPHFDCIKYRDCTPVRAAPVPPSALTGLELYKCVSAALTCGPCGARGAAERQCARCGVLLCRGRECSISCSRDQVRADACAFALCVDCHAGSSIEGRPAVGDLDAGLGLAQPLCEECGEDLVCPLHQCDINCTCETCGGLRCMGHTFVHPMIDYCQGNFPGCLWSHHDQPACAPAAGGIAYCSGCGWHYCATCFPRMRCPGAMVAPGGAAAGGSACHRCLRCYEHGACPSCLRRS
jgi:hypothetical protein